MGRPRRHEFPGAIHHVTTRGNRRANIFVDEYDRLLWLRFLEETALRFNIEIYSLCLMPNHFHMLVKTPDANLAAAMHFLNGKYAQKFNWRHGLSGHLQQGRYHEFHVSRQEHLLELLRYIVLNPVRARLVDHVDEWRWSTHRHVCNFIQRPSWLKAKWVLDQFAGKSDIEQIHSYRRFVDAGAASRPESPGQPRGEPHGHSASITVPTLEALEREHVNRSAAVSAAWHSAAYTREQIAGHFGISVRTVGRIIAAAVC